MSRISDADFAHVVRFAPLVSMDLILRDPDGCVLVGRRTNEPARGIYFVPGGVIRKNERFTAAFARILKTETGLDIPFSQARLLGAYEHLYDTNRFDDPAYGTHYVVLGFEVVLDDRPEVFRDSQHSDFCWLKAVDLLAADDVHENTKAYLAG